MELDDLKKAWNAADSQLKRTPLASEEEIEQLIAAGRGNTHKKLKKLSIMQRVSLVVGVVLFLLFFIVWGCMPDALTDKIPPYRLTVFLAFIGISLITGLLWDWKTFRWIRETRIDEMSVVEVSRRMTVFRRQMRNEIIAVCIWVVLFNTLNFWVMGYHLASLSTQVLVIVLFLALDVLIIFILYKKVLYKYIHDIHKNIEELKDLCIE